MAPTSGQFTSASMPHTAQERQFLCSILHSKTRRTSHPCALNRDPVAASIGGLEPPMNDNNGNHRTRWSSLRALETQAAGQRARAACLHAGAEQAIVQARRMRAEATRALAQLHEERLAEHRGCIVELLDAAIRVTRAEMGNVQLLDPASASLRIEAQRGFARPFLDYFGRVHRGEAACGVALKRRRRVVVPDVTESPIFRNTPALEVLLDAGARAVESTPLLGRNGRVLGMLSLHYRQERSLDGPNRALAPLLRQLVRVLDPVDPRSRRQA